MKNLRFLFCCFFVVGTWNWGWGQCDIMIGGSSVGGEIEICEGEVITMTASLGMNCNTSTFTWGNPMGVTSTAIGVSMEGVYSFTVVCNGLICIKTVTVSFVENPSISPSSIPPIICKEESTTLSSGVGSGFSIQWSDGVSSFMGDNIVVSPGITTNYSVTVTDNNCQSAQTSGSVTVTVNDLPAISPTAGNTIYCEGASIELFANPSGQTPLIFNWGGPNNWMSTDQNPTIDNAMTSTSGNYQVIITDSFECTNEGEVTIDVISDPSIEINNGICPSVCNNAIVTLSATAITNFDYQWQHFDGTAWQDVSNTSPNFTINGSQFPIGDNEFRVIVSDPSFPESNCDTGIAECTVIVFETPNAEIIGDLMVCQQQVGFYYLTETTANDFWTVLGGTIIEENEHGVLIKWENSGQGMIEVSQGSGNCFNTTFLMVNISNDFAETDTSSIIHYPFNNLLIVKDSTAACYQWGYYNPETNAMVALTEETFQAYAAGMDFLDNVDYWVETSANTDCSCPSISFRAATDEEAPPVFDDRQFVLFPNPNQGHFQLRANRLTDLRYILQIADVWGRVHYAKLIETPLGILEESVVLENLPNGLYYAILSNSKRVFQTKSFLIHK